MTDQSGVSLGWSQIILVFLKISRSLFLAAFLQPLPPFCLIVVNLKLSLLQEVLDRSPYIFLLCFEYLSSLITKRCESKEWTVVKASQGGPGFSHFSLQMTCFYLLRQLPKTVRLFQGSLIVFVGFLSRKSTKASLILFFPLMWIPKLKFLFVTSQEFKPPARSGDILGFLFFIKVVIVTLSTLLLTKSNLSWPGGNPKYYLFVFRPLKTQPN